MGKEDVLAELRSNLLSQIEGREEELARPLTKDEVAEILRGHGHPSIVAVRYQPKGQLIGPEIFPFYWFTLRRTLPLVIAVFVVSRAIELIYLPPQSRFVASSILGLLSLLFNFWAWMTLTFAILEFYRVRYPEKTNFYKNWDPRKLPRQEARSKEGLPRHPIADLVLSVAFTLWLLAFPRFPYLLFGPGAWYMGRLSMDLAPVWHKFYWAIVALNCLQIIFKSIALLRSAQPWRKPMKLVEQLFGFGTLLLLLQVREYIVYVGPVSDASRQHFEAMNLGIHRAFEFVVVILALKIIWDIVQMITSSRRHDETSTPGHVKSV
jgi:hypothetical protein